MFDELVKFFVVLLVVVEPLSLLPVLAGLTEGADDAYRRRMSWKAVRLSAVVCLVFAVGGTALLGLLGISVDAFKVGGGSPERVIRKAAMFALAGVRRPFGMAGAGRRHGVPLFGLRRDPTAARTGGSALRLSPVSAGRALTRPAFHRLTSAPCSWRNT